MKLWIARDRKGKLTLHDDKPMYVNKDCEVIYQYWVTREVWDNEVYDGTYIVLNKELFPEITFENSPQEVFLMTQEELKEREREAYKLGIASAILEEGNNNK